MDAAPLPSAPAADAALAVPQDGTAQPTPAEEDAPQTRARTRAGIQASLVAAPLPEGAAATPGLGPDRTTAIPARVPASPSLTSLGMQYMALSRSVCTEKILGRETLFSVSLTLPNMVASLVAVQPVPLCHLPCSFQVINLDMDQKASCNLPSNDFGFRWPGLSPPSLYPGRHFVAFSNRSLWEFNPDMDLKAGSGCFAAA